MVPKQARHATWVRTVIVAGITLALTASTRASGPSPYDGIVVFGTSLSDSGNAFALGGGTNTPPDYDVDPFLVPNSPYAKGGHHLTNGETWIEQLARTLGLTASVSPAFRGSSSTATNYAVGAARSYADGVTLNLVVQVNTFLQDAGGSAPSGNLYVIEMGSNDVRDAIVAFLSGQDGSAIITAAVTSIAQRVGELYAAGARNFLVWNVPDTGLTPAVRALDATIPGVSAFATSVTFGFNLALSAALTPLKALPGIHISDVDIFTLMQQVAASPSAFGLTNATGACITPGVQPFSCKSPDDYLFWDGIHPTRAGHAIIADEAASVLTP